MRGGNPTPELLEDLYRSFRLRAGERISPLNAFLTRNALLLDPRDHGTSLRFSPRNLEQISELAKAAPAGLTYNFLWLVVQYVILNAPRVDQWIEFNEVASGLSILNKPDQVKSKLLGLERIDQQSMYAMRLYAGLHAYSDTAISEYISSNLTSNWIKSRFLYPLIYYAINQPSRSVLEQMLDHLLPADRTGRSEKVLIRFLLEPQSTSDVSLAYRCYAGLMSHPYDALEYVTQYFEAAAAKRSEPPQDELDLLRALAARFPQHRISGVVAVLDSAKLPTLASPKAIGGMQVEEEGVREELICLIGTGRTATGKFSESPLIQALSALRWQLYPTKENYELINVYRHRFSMLNSGAFVDWISRALFLYEREPYEHELVWLLRGALMCDGVFPLLLMGPCGPAAIDAWSGIVLDSASELVPLVETAFGPDAKARVDRLWINASNWRVSQLQRAGKVKEWASTARATFPVWVNPRYLSGLDWIWLSEVIRERGVLPFRGTADGVYVLFLRQLEEGVREYSALRFCIEPFVERGAPEAFLDWLIGEFGRDALAMVRTILTPDAILKLRLAENYTAALTARLSLLEACVKRFNFVSGVLDEEELRQEAAALTASLSRMSLGARQFELPWDVLKADAATRNAATYDAYAALAYAVAESSSVTLARRQSTYPFANGAIGEYEGRNREWPLILTIAGVIDTFLTHPTAGIEAILSVRIRHDNFRREVMAAVHQVTRSPIQGVRRSTVQKFGKSLEPLVSREVNAWLDARMHTRRKGKEEACFDFTPSREEMGNLLAQSLAAGDLGDVIDTAFTWIRPRLEAQLDLAREALGADLCPRLRSAVTRLASELDSTEHDTEEVERLTGAIGTALERRLKELEEWFRVPDRPRETSLTLQEIYLAVQQRFQSKTANPRVEFGCLPESLSGHEVGPEHIRFMYDLLSELVQNAIKHSGLAKVRMSVRSATIDGRAGLVISNFTQLGKAESKTIIAGHPYENMHDALFGEGNSGCRKVAYLASSILRDPTNISTIQRRRAFHVMVPIGAVVNGP